MITFLIILLHFQSCFMKSWSFDLILLLFCFFKQKIEVIDEEDDDDDDYNGELVVSDLEQMQSLLEFKVKTHITMTDWASCNDIIISSRWIILDGLSTVRKLQEYN